MPPNGRSGRFSGREGHTAQQVPPRPASPFERISEFDALDAGTPPRNTVGAVTVEVTIPPRQIVDSTEPRGAALPEEEELDLEYEEADYDALDAGTPPRITGGAATVEVTIPPRQTDDLTERSAFLDRQNISLHRREVLGMTRELVCTHNHRRMCLRPGLRRDTTEPIPTAPMRGGRIHKSPGARLAQLETLPCHHALAGRLAASTLPGTKKW
jgi:hypothetical protein